MQARFGVVVDSEAVVPCSSRSVLSVQYTLELLCIGDHRSLSWEYRSHYVDYREREPKRKTSTANTLYIYIYVYAVRRSAMIGYDFRMIGKSDGVHDNGSK